MSCFCVVSAGSVWLLQSFQNPWMSSWPNYRTTWKKPWTQWCALNVRASTSAYDWHCHLSPVLSYKLLFCVTFLCFYVDLSVVFSPGALRWTVSLARPDSVLNVINGTVPRRETCGLNRVCWDCASRTSPSWTAKSLTLLVVYWHPHHWIFVYMLYAHAVRLSSCSHRVGRLSAYKHLSRHSSRAISYLFRL